MISWGCRLVWIGQTKALLKNNSGSQVWDLMTQEAVPQGLFGNSNPGTPIHKSKTFKNKKISKIL